MRSILAVCILFLTSSAAASSISKEAIQRPIRAHMAEIRSCWDAASKDRDPPPTGAMVLTFRIDRDGKVRDARVDRNTTGDADLAVCVRRVFLTLTYPESPEPIRVTYPLVFAIDED